MNPAQLNILKADLRRARKDLRELAEIVALHVRVDVAPDACMPRLTRLRESMQGRK